MNILQVVNSTFGVRNAIGARALHIALNLPPEAELLVLARGATAEAKERYQVLQCGLSPAVGKTLKAVNVYLWRRFPHKRILQRRFVADARRCFSRLSVEEIDLVHTWAEIPEVILEAKRRNPRLVAIRDVSMRPACAAPSIAASPLDSVQRDASGVDYFLAPSPIVAESLTSECGIEANRIFTVPFGVDVELFRPSGKLAGSAPGPVGCFSVAFSGHLDRRKGIPELLAAWEELDLPNAELHLYGRVYPEVRPLLNGAKERGIRVHGFVDLPEYLPRHDLFVLPSYREGSAKSVYEALASGLPVVTTPEAGSVVRDGIEGRIVSAGDVSGLAGAIRQFCDDPALRARAAVAARARAEEFTWERYGSSVARVYRTAVNRGPWPR